MKEEREIFNKNVAVAIGKLLSECKDIRSWNFHLYGSLPPPNEGDPDWGRDVLTLWATVPGCKKPQALEITIRTELLHHIKNIKVFDNWFERFKKSEQKEETL